jgi:hypothetical protein
MEAKAKKLEAILAVKADVEQQLEQTQLISKKIEKQNTVLQKELVG